MRLLYRTLYCTQLGAVKLRRPNATAYLPEAYGCVEGRRRYCPVIWPGYRLVRLHARDAKDDRHNEDSCGVAAIVPDIHIDAVLATFR